MNLQFNIDHTAGLPSGLLVTTPIHGTAIFEVAP